ncbi:hypothetical protein COV20_04870 [Candidatus Woesearchaeota archaeon CG10_big_fil_rev_8_21_14_0_10_45_16]|nr:MAG: hypothetical protein COV20_04870 [Candidatus Woesearchaeota archaeon CG10_big_fil_rev_8_21_14_0_10_45_16]
MRSKRAERDWKRRGQVSVTFNWIYILVAGAVILLFFVGIIFKQKASAEQQLSIEVVDILESIFSGAQASEKTKTPIDTSGLADYTLYFKCEDKVTTYGIKDSSGSAEAPLAPIFSPTELQTPRLILWSLPYRLPYKITDFLLITSPNTKYFLIGDIKFANEFINASDDPDPRNKINIEYVLAGDYAGIDAEGNYNVRVVDLDGSVVDASNPLPPGLLQMEDLRVTGVSFRGNNVFFFHKKGSNWEAEGPVPIVSVDPVRDVAKYASIIAGSKQIYECNMQKAFERASLVTRAYIGKTESLVSQYQDDPGACLPFLQEGDKSAMTRIGLLQGGLARCGNELTYQLCSHDDLRNYAKDIQTRNEQLRTGACRTLY